MQTPILLPIQMPQTWGPIIIKENLGIEDQPTVEDTTANEDGENECSGSVTTTPATSSLRLTRGSPNKTRMGHTWVLKKAKVIISTKLREVLCDRCWMKGQECLSQIKGGKALDACHQEMGKVEGCLNPMKI